MSMQLAVSQPLYDHVDFNVFVDEKSRIINSAPDRGAEYCADRVCLSAIISSEQHAMFTNFLCMLPMAVARSSGSVVIRYVLPVLWMTSYLLMIQGCSTSPPS